MKSSSLKIFIAFIMLTPLAGSKATAALVKVQLLQGLKKKQVSLMEICSTGGYQGKCLSLSLRNNTDKSIEVSMDPALIFKPADAAYQHLVSVGEESIVLAPCEEKSISLETFCGKASAHSPARNVPYSLWKQGDHALILASRYIKENSLFSYLGQHAIWMFTDRHPLSNVYDPGKPESKPFVTYLAKITHQEVPQFYTYHNVSTSNGRYAAHQGSNRAVYDKTISKIYVDVDWSGEKRRNTHILVLDGKRHLYRTIEDGEIISSGGLHNVKVMLDPAKDPPGTYYVQLKDDENNIWLERKAIVSRF